MPKRVLTGVIVSDKTNKTVVVNVERKAKHPLYGKIIRRTKKYHAHDEANEFKQGETVRIEETAPISKLKTWKVIDRVNTRATLRASQHLDALHPLRAAVVSDVEIGLHLDHRSGSFSSGADTDRSPPKIRP